MTYDDDRLQVQVLPELQDISEKEMEDLPKYPPFEKGRVIQGKCHLEYGDEAEYVWCLCTPDLQVGYILHKANVYGKNTEQYRDSNSYLDVKQFIIARRALPDDFDYNHIDVVKWYDTAQGGSIELYNYITGDWFLINRSGTILSVQQQEIHLRVGTPPNPPATGPVAHSSIIMVPDKIHFKSPNIEFHCDDLVLGKHGLQLGGILGLVPSMDNGVPVIPCEGIHV